MIFLVCKVDWNESVKSIGYLNLYDLIVLLLGINVVLFLWFVIVCCLMSFLISFYWFIEDIDKSNVDGCFICFLLFFFCYL